ncbi:hypothetical protein L0Z42_22630 [Burkholderia multivorans]|uniref:hypothetical protein n=1 Tax=Burkholderia multivorans TaxID=87883 RepID=UPI0020185CBA|nr:hypothetical protein [Burkholderia multivorans]MCO1373300.1 hypothetical protein [Burkholderia multivorans]MCO1455440.1 hypothetical protein [Burkholderia multivorans]MCO1469993.1 hypothetical protein [Burkholderia multivorans]UQO20363.1 hypothetical protein L0Z02_19995 [Burkholderia multivorans]UQO83454.1 hypothetical protein L0Y86_03765 [Burkholderia multivorans]
MVAQDRLDAVGEAPVQPRIAESGGDQIVQQGGRMIVALAEFGVDRAGRGACCQRADHARTRKRNGDVNGAGRPERDIHRLTGIDDRHGFDGRQLFAIDLGGRIAGMARDRNHEHQRGEALLVE